MSLHSALRTRARQLLLFAWVLAALSFATPASSEPGPIVVGSKAFTESRVLAEVFAQVLRAHTEREVVVRDNLGGTMIVFAALSAGDIDIYPEYTGTAWAAVLNRTDVKPALETYATVQQAYQTKFGATWLAPLGFTNSYALAARTADATTRGWRALSDVAGSSGGSGWRVGMSHEFMERTDGWPGLSSRYGLTAADAVGMEHALLYPAVAAGQVDLIEAYTTDAKLVDAGLTVLADDAQFFPPYECAPVVRTAALEAAPEIRRALARLAFAISTSDMQRMNAAVERDGASYAQAAASFISTLPHEPRAPGRASNEAQATAGPSTFDRIHPMLSRHIFLTGLALLLAVILGVPLGLLVARRRRTAQAVLGATGVIQTIPSLALLAFFIPLPGLGLGSRSAILALFLYSLLPIVRNTVTGIQGISPALLDAANGMGLTATQRLRHIEFPLARPTIIAGVRTAATIGIGVATLAAFIGAGGLGEAILTGLQLNDPVLILSGAIPAAALALATDGIIALIARRLQHR